MFRRSVSLLLALGIATASARAATPSPPMQASPAPELLARSSGSVNISRHGDENPMVEIARSVFWGGVAGLAIGTAITLADDNHSGEPIRWGIVVGTFAGLGAGIYFVANRPIPASMLEIHDGRLTPNPAALAAIEPVPGGARVRAVGVRF
jgi:hypothetical protein